MEAELHSQPNLQAHHPIAALKRATRNGTAANKKPGVTLPPAANADHNTKPSAFALNSEDFIHFCSLLASAQDHLPNSTDDDLTRSALRSMSDFVITQESQRQAAPTTPSIDQIKATLLADAQSACTGLQIAVECGESGDTGARLLACAEGKLRDCIQVMERSPLTNASTSYWMHLLFNVQACMEGVMAVDAGTHRGIATAGPHAVLARLIADLDRTDWPTETGEEERAREFMAGKALAAKLLDEAFEVDGMGDEGELRAYYRGRDVPQRAFVRPYFDAVSADPGLAEGFFAVLSCQLIIAPESGLVPDDVREVPYLDCIGGPDTTYMSEEDDEPGEPTQEADEHVLTRTDIAIDASTFIARVSGHFARAQDKLQPCDLAAINRAAGVILSALDDSVIGDDELATTLEQALEEASVILLAQPPKSTGIAAISTDQAIPKANFSRQT